MKNNSTVLSCLTALAVLLSSSMVTTTLNAKAVNTVANPQQKKTPPASKVVPHPADWVTISDSKKGYSFDVPKGTDYNSQLADKRSNVDVFAAVTPEPTRVGIFVFAFKNPKLSKDNLLDFAEETLQNGGQTKIKFGNITDLSDDYSLAPITLLNKEGAPVRGKVLVATDVTDNYVMIVMCEESKFKANENVIDEIWGSFSMRSGGASGKS